MEEKPLEFNFPVTCRGRTGSGTEFLHIPIKFELKIYQKIGDEEGIYTDVSGCDYNDKKNRKLCNATHIGNGIYSKGYCPYAVDLPKAMDHIKRGLDYERVKK